MRWTPFEYQGDVYDLSHLHPFSTRYEQPSKDGKPTRIYKVDVEFSLHCFTRGAKVHETPDSALFYSDSRETRIFDLQRYQLSKRLPEIVNCLAQRRCYHTGKGNFFTIEIVNELDGSRIEYDIFFAVSYSSKKGFVKLYVQSAYIRDEAHGGNRPDMLKIGFFVILYNTMNRKQISPGQK